MCMCKYLNVHRSVLMAYLPTCSVFNKQVSLSTYYVLYIVVDMRQLEDV